MSHSAEGYSVTSSTTGGDASFRVFIYNLQHPQKEDVKLTVRIRELSYAAAKAEFPDIPDAPISENEVSAWWKRINPSK